MTSRLTRILAIAAITIMTFASAPVRAAEFTLLIYETPAGIARRTDQKSGPAYWKAFADYAEAMKAAGVLRGGMPLQDSTHARVVRVRNGHTAVTSSVHATSKEHLGGFFTIDVPDRDAALVWAAKAPAALTGAIEVRPAFPAPPMR